MRPVQVLGGGDSASVLGCCKCFPFVVVPVVQKEFHLGLPEGTTGQPLVPAPGINCCGRGCSPCVCPRVMVGISKHFVVGRMTSHLGDPNPPSVPRLNIATPAPKFLYS
tara:strand:- start:747 stop:1073 length:327 start_codon:yes stop_codon:yes gene_type:complete